MNALHKYMTNKSLTCNEFAKISGISQPTVWRIKKGETTPSALTALRIEQATNGEVTLRDLLFLKA